MNKTLIAVRSVELSSFEFTEVLPIFNLLQSAMLLVSILRTMSRILPRLLYAARKAYTPGTAIPAVHHIQLSLILVKYSTCIRRFSGT
jgi:hypothetical protein